jgi:hypothetical protein
MTSQGYKPEVHYHGFTDVFKPGVGMHICNPQHLGDGSYEFKTSLAYHNETLC